MNNELKIVEVPTIKEPIQPSPGFAKEHETRKTHLELLVQTVPGQERIKDAYSRLRREKHDNGVLSIGPGQPKQLREMVDEILCWEFSRDESRNS